MNANIGKKLTLLLLSVHRSTISHTTLITCHHFTLSNKTQHANIQSASLQYLVTTHGDHLLETIKHLAKELSLTLDGEASALIVSTNKADQVANSQRKLIPDKLQAWKMWSEEGLSIHQIAVCLFLKRRPQLTLPAFYAPHCSQCSFAELPW